MYQLLWHSKSHLFATTLTSICYSRFTAPYNYSAGFVIVYDNQELKMYLPAETISERIKQAALFFSQNSNYLYFLQECKNLKKTYQIFYGSLGEDFSQFSNESLVSIFKTLVELQARCASFFQGTSEYAIQGITSDLEAELKSVLSNWQLALAELSVAVSPEIEREKKDFSTLKKSQHPDVLGHIKKYPWVCAKNFFFDEATDGLKEMMKNYAVKSDQLDIQKTNKKEFRFLLKNHRIAVLARKLRELGRVRVDLKGLLCWKLLGSPLYTEIANRLVIEPSKLFYIYNIDEIIDLLSRRQKYQPLHVMVGPRVCVGQGSSYTMLTGEKAQKFITENLNLAVGRGELRGMVVFPGKVTGQARVILQAPIGEMAKQEFNQGDILITSMTNPNMSFLISRSAGVITEEGGITCHAAIICRELKKPCVVGVKHITDVFKNGDVVELDAENGVVNKVINDV